MGKYHIEVSSLAEIHLKQIKKSGQKSFIKKIEVLFRELSEHPRRGTGRPERLKGFEEEVWSRRIDMKNRLVYGIDDQKVVVVVISALGHYDDK